MQTEMGRMPNLGERRLSFHCSLGDEEMPETGTSAQNHRCRRNRRRSEITEDYVEIIAYLTAAGNTARPVDVARCLGVTPETVIQTVNRLRRLGLASNKPYRSIFLTNRGQQVAEDVGRRRRIIIQLLEALGVPTDVAAVDANGILHSISEETLAAFSHYTNKLRCLRPL